MDINTITQLIGTLGFPIFACVAMGLYVVWLQKNDDKIVLKVAEIAASMQESLAANTEAFNQLSTQIKENTNK